MVRVAIFHGHAHPFPGVPGSVISKLLGLAGSRMEVDLDMAMEGKMLYLRSAGDYQFVLYLHMTVDST